MPELIPDRLSDAAWSADACTWTRLVEPAGTLKSRRCAAASWSAVTEKTFTLPVPQKPSTAVYGDENPTPATVPAVVVPLGP